MQVEQRTVFTQRSRSFLSRRVGRSGQRFSIRWPSLQRVMITQQSSLAVRCAPDPCLEFVLNSGLSAPTHCLCSQAVNNPNGQSQQSPPLQTWIKSAHTSKARLSGQGLGFEVQYWARHAFHPKPSSGVLPGENTCRILETQVRLPVYGRKKKFPNSEHRDHQETPRDDPESTRSPLGQTFVRHHYHHDSPPWSAGFQESRGKSEANLLESSMKRACRKKWPHRTV